MIWLCTNCFCFVWKIEFESDVWVGKNTTHFNVYFSNTATVVLNLNVESDAFPTTTFCQLCQQLLFKFKLHLVYVPNSNSTLGKCIGKSSEKSFDFNNNSTTKTIPRRLSVLLILSEEKKWNEIKWKKDSFDLWAKRRQNEIHARMYTHTPHTHDTTPSTYLTDSVCTYQLFCVCHGQIMYPHMWRVNDRYGWMDGQADRRKDMIRYYNTSFCESITIVGFVYKIKKGEKTTRTATTKTSTTTITTPMKAVL